jgi:putative alpha-1,2-mannosidase
MGTDVAQQRLDHIFALPAEVQNREQLYGIYYRFDQWVPGNETDLGAPYLYPFLHEPWKTQAELAASRGDWRPTIDGEPGNDDLGGLSGWYVWDALGIGPFEPGAPLYMVGSPLFSSATIALRHHRTFTIDAPAATPATPYVQSATLDGRPLDRVWFDDATLRRGGTLHLDMGPASSTWGATAAPPSVSDPDFSLGELGCSN